MIGGPIGWPIGGVINTDGLAASASITLDGLTLSFTGTVALKAAASITLDGVTLSFTGAVAIKAQAAITLADVSVTSTGVIALKAAAAITLDDVGITFSGAVALKAAVTVTLDDLGQDDLHGGPETTITDTEVLQLPINCILAGQQHYKESGREYEIRPRNARERTSVTRSGVRKLRGAKPSYTVTTNNRGYD